jgi:hypothetical protein
MEGDECRSVLGEGLEAARASGEFALVHEHGNFLVDGFYDGTVVEALDMEIGALLGLLIEAVDDVLPGKGVTRDKGRNGCNDDLSLDGGGRLGVRRFERGIVAVLAGVGVAGLGAPVLKRWEAGRR